MTETEQKLWDIFVLNELGWRHHPGNHNTEWDLQEIFENADTYILRRLEYLEGDTKCR